MWTIKFRNGSVKRFKFPIRTTAEGSIKPFDGKPEPGDLDSELLFTEAELKSPIATVMEEASVTDADLKKEWKMDDYANLV
jgi:adenylylsulfate reductase subunit B